MNPPQSGLAVPARQGPPNAVLASLLATPELSVMGGDYAAQVTAVQAQRHREIVLGHPGETHKDFLRSPVSTKLLAGPFHHQLFVYCANSPLALLDVTAAIAQAGGSIYNIFLFPRTDGSLLIECAFILRERVELEKIVPALGEIFRLARKPQAGKCEPVRDLEITRDPKDAAVIPTSAPPTPRGCSTASSARSSSWDCASSGPTSAPCRAAPRIPSPSRAARARPLIGAPPSRISWRKSARGRTSRRTTSSSP